ncbi:MAG: hypothetical protein JNM27_04970 [Leptospirales bacterium]|nr:hypothetical protein [Leptospirales bacterium]
MSTEPTPDQILQALHESGYLFEQEMGNLVESLGYTVFPNWAYKDPISGKSRELDFVASKTFTVSDTSDIEVIVRLMCECKNSSTPICSLSRLKSPRDGHEEAKGYVFPKRDFKIPLKTEGNSNSYRLIGPLEGLDLRSKHYYYRAAQKSVQICKIVREKKSFQATHADLHDSVILPLAHALSHEIHQFSTGNYSKNYVFLFVPLVITAAPLYRFDTVSDKLENIMHESLLRELQSQTAAGTFLFDFVSGSAGLQQFLSEKIEPFAFQVAQTAKSKPELFRKR